MFITYEQASNIPTSWDEINDNNPFLNKEYLSRLEKLNFCYQRYHLNEREKIALVSYRLKLNIFTFSRNLSFKIPVNIIGIPMSVSKKGYHIKNPTQINKLNNYIKSLNGFYVILNANDNFNISKGNTLPTYRITIKWGSFVEYISCMRSSYRYRIKKAIKKFKDVEIKELSDNRSFDEKMYKLYCNVYENSSEKLEKLSIDFFKEFPAKIIKFSVNNEVIAFVQLVENGEELIFLFGGFDHALNQSYDLYINILVKIIQYGIDEGFKYIDLGQTAEETKSKIGAIGQEKYMYVHHSNRVIDFIINRLIDKFSYNQYKVTHRVFKERNNENSDGEMS